MGVSHNIVLPGRRRGYHTKSRTGCQTCKVRRVKCDGISTFHSSTLAREGPCRNCVRLGFRCEGPRFTFVINREQQLDFWSPPKDNCSRVPQLLTDSQFATAQETAAFQYFMEITLPWFASPKGDRCDGVQCYKFWYPSTLQLMHHEPLIKHLVLAVASSHGYVQDLLIAASTGQEKKAPNRGFERDVFLLKHYCTALSILREQRTHISTTLVACIILSCVDFFRCQSQLFLQHLEFGERIVRDHYNEDDNSPTSDASTMISEGGQRRHPAVKSSNDECDSIIRECVVPTLKLLKGNSSWMVNVIS